MKGRGFDRKMLDSDSASVASFVSIGSSEAQDTPSARSGGTVSSSTSVGISADGGVAIADASGGDNNFAFVS